MVNPQLLQHIDLFSGLGTDDLNKLAKIINIRKVKKGEYIFKKGEPRKEFFIIISGQITLKQSIIKTEEGWTILKENDFISAKSLLDASLRHEQNALALEESQVLVIANKDYNNLIKKNSHIGTLIANELISGLNERLRHSTNKLVALYKTGQIAAEEENLEIIAEKTLKVILSVISAQKALFGIFNKYKNEVSILAALGFSKNKDIIHKKFRLKEDKIIQEMADNEDIFKSGDEENILLKSNYGMNEALGCPLFFDGKFVGMILLGDKEKGKFSANNEILLRLIAGQISGAIYRAGKREEAKAEEEMRRTYISH